MVYLKIPSRRVDRVFTAKGTQNLLVESQGAFPFLCLLKKATHLPNKKKKKKKCWFYLKDTSQSMIQSFTSVVSLENISVKNMWHHRMQNVVFGEKRGMHITSEKLFIFLSCLPVLWTTQAVAPFFFFPYDMANIN